MLHTKFQDHRLVGSVEEDCLPYKGIVDILVM